MCVKNILLLLILIHPVFCVGQRPGATFLLISPSARAVGTAYAFTATADDAYVNYYNGAGLAFLSSRPIVLSYCGYQTGFVPGNRYYYLGFGYPGEKSGFGMDVIWFYIPPYGPHITGERPHTGQHLAVKLSYARKLMETWSVGAGVKVVYQYNNKESWSDDPRWPPGLYSGRQGVAATPVFDFNSLYVASHVFTVGLVLHNIGPNIRYTESDNRDPLPRFIRTGLAYKPIDNRSLKCTISGEMTKVLVGILGVGDDTFWGTLKSEFREIWKAIGIEITLYELISLRGGYLRDHAGERKGCTFGAGLHARPFNFDVGIDENIFDWLPQNRTVSISCRL